LSKSQLNSRIQFPSSKFNGQNNVKEPLSVKYESRKSRNPNRAFCCDLNITRFHTQSLAVPNLYPTQHTTHYTRSRQATDDSSCELRATSCELKALSTARYVPTAYIYSRHLLFRSSEFSSLTSHTSRQIVCPIINRFIFRLFKINYGRQGQ
jgi:hypothetical protein